MKSSFQKIILLLAFMPFSLFAQSAVEREWELLKDQRSKALTTAVDPINQRYYEGLTKLIDRATQAKDLETAVKLKEELSRLAYEKAASAGNSKLESISIKSDDPVSKLPGTSWYWGSNKSMKFTFMRNGRFSGHLKGAIWRPISSDLIFYTWGGSAYSGVMRVPKGFERLDAAEWQGGTPIAPNVVLATKAN